MHAERGLTTERRSGTRTATTFRKLPSGESGAKGEGGERSVHVWFYRRPAAES